MPIGIINSSWGGTPAETWVHADTLAASPLLAKEAAKAWERPYGPHLPGKAYNAMIAPLIPFRLAGVLWYQGESNIHSPHTYQELLPTLIRSWRSAWGWEFPFYFAQIAPYAYGSPYQGVLIRDGQRRSLRVPKTGMVVLSDIGDVQDMHPSNKLDVGRRFAHLALNKTYGQTGFPASGPLYRQMQTEGDKIRLHFDYAEGGLVAKGGALTHFEIAGEDQQFVPAQATIEGSTLVVRAKGVAKPVAVRFAWSNTAEPNLFNRQGLPASSFRTDDWEMPKK
ncbi:sialate O-acetylesterase [Cesiribacter andamanensis]|uniref:Sialate O-acetylesterase domain-containing protein n=1 Tax=Cesiribacter andamanensis AMV16 TaxID=1279009 RepID=M7NQK3_9BACT|nr:sialate O-acetylesterase [Cesiribacter andamanensis]EMR04005.1 hypothetical protein ADICEAN_00876 [Cesiribacter andamanensis AMV16]